VKRQNLLLLLVALVFSACGTSGSGEGGGSVVGPTPPGANVMQLTVNSGPTGNSVNSPFTSVTICAPGTSQCQTIDGIVVDTGSYGLRLFASQISVNLPPETTSSGETIVECAYFGSFTTWGPMKTAAVILGKEPAVNVPIQVMNDPNFPAPPSPTSSECSGSSPPQVCQCLQSALNPTIANSPQIVGANGILGVGVFQNDCPACASPPGSGNPGYYACPSGNASACSVVPVAANEQAENPVVSLPADNNGVVINLPSIPADGAQSVTGSMLLGINTQSNNGLGSAAVYTLDSSGMLTTTFNGQNYPGFLDTGSNALFFPDPSLATCPSDPGFYCPSSTYQASAINTGFNNQSGTVTFQIANAQTLFAANNGGNTAFNDLGGPLSGMFDWGLPFFFGRPVFFGIAGQNPSISGNSPFYAY